MREPDSLGPPRGISRHLTEEGALPICEQCNSSGDSKPVEIFSNDGGLGFRVNRMWAPRPFGGKCRWVYLCRECSWAILKEAGGWEEPWFASADVYGIHPDCGQCKGRA